MGCAVCMGCTHGLYAAVWCMAWVSDGSVVYGRVVYTLSDHENGYVYCS
jgi:hypothetical protein